jgi:signal transduction histidine kinase
MRIPPVVERHWFDVLVVGLTIGGIAEVLLNDEVQGSTPGLIAFAFLWGLPLLARRRLPVIAPTLVFVAVSAQAVLWPHSVGYQFCTFMIVLLATGLYGINLTNRRDRLAGAAVVLATLMIVVGMDPEGSWTDGLTTGPVIGVAWLIGHIYRNNTVRTAELRERAERLERERETEARAAAAEERARIAREMHDVVAHSLSVMVVQAEAAEAMLDGDPERARRPLAAVQDTGRSALTELRRMLGVMREIADEGPALAPQPGLAGLDTLVAHVRDAGLPVTLRVEGDPRPLPPGVDLSAYRIVQEGLTNALKHAGPARAEVLVRYGPRDLELAVRDDGRGHDPHANGGGHGLVGMRERVALYGGRLSAGPLPAPDHGFALTATLPLDAEPSR